MEVASLLKDQTINNCNDKPAINKKGLLKNFSEIAVIVIAGLLLLVVTDMYNFLSSEKTSLAIQEQKIETITSKLSSDEIAIDKKFDKLDEKIDQRFNKVDDKLTIIMSK